MATKDLMEWSDREIIFTLHETRGIGAQTIRKLVKQGLLRRCLAFSQEAWREAGLNRSQAAAAAETMNRSFFIRRSYYYKEAQIRWMTVLDTNYPEMLRQIADPPWVIYYIGREELLVSPAASIVGTRGPTAYGRRQAMKLAGELSHAGITVVSGMAKGIDAYAHEGALAGTGSTIAVLGTPVNRIYPPQNASLYRAIAERGLILSEYPVGSPFHPGMFPQRNRIIAGLSSATVVVEATKGSGSLITAGQAVDYNREVFAVPGPLGAIKSEGANELITRGEAALLTGVEPILSHIIRTAEPEVIRSALSDPPTCDNNAAQEAESPKQDNSRQLPDKAGQVTDAEALILSLLGDQPRTADELCELTGMAFGHLHALLINLSIKHKIEQHPGSLYSAV
ncbi:DNA-processing protein DprA [Paenibacillus tarimensis]|uniref:DNA-processing protein DprA n=1 Tax=Paenibacillus tarimensis TaxID=416012 RepID=UPI001F34C268|nr:DNA-processing protein DprA [Paenibacillus tarimensis]MCF2942293.1 DNA-processing protein DprA [Paenibacillus tarimensis]